MKLTTRIKKWIVQSVIFSGVFFLTLIAIFFISLYPDVQEIWEKKQELIRVFDSYNTIVANGLNYGQFKKNIAPSIDSNYDKLLLENVDESFYSQHFTNTWSLSYDVFLDGIEQKIANIKSSDEYIQKDTYLNAFLPNYDKTNSFGDDTLTDFYFINHVENLLYWFNLSYSGEIGVGNIVNIDESENTSPNQSTARDDLQEDIYAIPLDFKIVGRKSDIVDFLHYFENVSRISISDGGFLVHNDEFIKKRIDGPLFASEYNIYENQLSEITSLFLDTYPDSSARSAESLATTMKTVLWSERYEMEVSLNFYVAGVPGYKMQNYINNFFDTYTLVWNDLKRDTQKFLAQRYKYQSSDKIVAIQGLQSLESLMASFEEDIKNLRRLSANPQNIEKAYSQSVEFTKQLEKIQQSYNSKLEILSQ